MRRVRCHRRVRVIAGLNLRVSGVEMIAVGDGISEPRHVERFNWALFLAFAAFGMLVAMIGLAADAARRNTADGSSKRRPVGFP